MAPTVCILDFSSGNVGSVRNIFRTFTDQVIISNEPNDIEEATHLVLPGVGAFGAAMEKIRRYIPIQMLEEVVLQKKKPFLGICVGMQVLADKGLEYGEHAGLGWIQGVVKKLESGEQPLPHVGWNDITITKSTPLLNGLDAIRDFYFVHSYAFSLRDRSQVCAVAEYGEIFDCVLNQGNIFGVQFHPEKSQKAGQRLVKNFLEIGQE